MPMSERTPRGHGRPLRADVYHRLDAQIAELRERMGGLPDPADAYGIWRDICYEEAHHSADIEGDTLVLKQDRRSYSGKAGRSATRSSASIWRYRPTMHRTGSNDKSSPRPGSCILAAY